MASNPPFMFGAAGAGDGQPAPSLPFQPQQHHAATSSASIAPSAQQAAFQQNAQLPGIDMSALAGISQEQLILIRRLMEAGALPLPPPPPAATAPPSVTAPTAVTPSVAPVQQANARQQDVEVDKEEGEIEEVGDISTPTSDVNDLARKVTPRGPKSMTSRKSSRQGSMSTKQSRAATPFRRHSSSRRTLFTPGDDNHDIVRMAKEKQSKDFILAMHQAGYTYRQLAPMVDDTKPLRRIFKLLGLPVSFDHGSASGMQLPQHPPFATHSSKATSDLNTPSEGLPKSAVSKPPPQTKPPAKADRSAYLAKLQALKVGKAPSTSSPSTPQEPIQAAPTAQQSSGVSTPAAPASAAVAGSVTRPTPISKAVKTELARQRLEAFKAERAAKQQAQLSSNVPQVASADGLGSGLQAIAAKVDQQISPLDTQEAHPPSAANPAAFSPTLPTPTRSFSGLPGLFTNNAVPQASGSPDEGLPQPGRRVSQPVSQPPNPLHLPQKRSSTDLISAAPTPSKRPFGQSRSASEDESFIIENSEDEDEGVPMEIDSAPSTTNTWPKPMTDTASLVDSKTAFAATGLDDANSTTYEQKLKAIEALHRKIAEKEAKRKAAERAANPQGGVATTTPGLPGISSPSTVAAAASPLKNDGSRSPATLFTPERPVSAGASKLRQQKEELQQRIAELEDAQRPAGTANPSSQEAAPRVEKAAEVRQPGEAVHTATISGSEHPASDTEAEVPQVPAPAVATEASEDGEVNDDSDFDFYGDEAADASKLTRSPPKVGLQGTTRGDVSTAAAAEQEYPLSPSSKEDEAAPTQSGALAADGMGEDLDAETTIDRSEPASPVGSSTASNAFRVFHASAAPEIVMSGEDSDEISAEEEEEHDDDIYRPAEADHEQTTPEVVDHVTAINEDFINGEVDDLANAESSDTSSEGTSESGAYEPEPAAEEEDTSFAAHTKHEADDLAAELQPDAHVAALTDPSDQVRSTFGGLHGD